MVKLDKRIVKEEVRIAGGALSGLAYGVIKVASFLMAQSLPLGDQML